jgi:hydroxymethylglutaryl-CoA reductase
MPLTPKATHIPVALERDVNGNLVGSLELPMPVGLVGGATKVHPTAQAMIKLLEVSSAQDLGEIIVAVGLAQNLAACLALVTEGIQRGHMSMHASNIALAAGASPDELPEVVARLIKDKVVRQDHAEQLLAEMRSEPPGEQ